MSVGSLVSQFVLVCFCWIFSSLLSYFLLKALLILYLVKSSENVTCCWYWNKLLKHTSNDLNIIISFRSLLLFHMHSLQRECIQAAAFYLTPLFMRGSLGDRWCSLFPNSFIHARQPHKGALLDYIQQDSTEPPHLSHSAPSPADSRSVHHGSVSSCPHPPMQPCPSSCECDDGREWPRGTSHDPSLFRLSSAPGIP